MKDAWVKFEIDLNSFGEGLVIAHDEATGDLVIRDANGIHWWGVEDHIELIEQPTARAVNA
ncbi:hypothetical protein QO239_10185 [Cupriavidus taiwanensis]|uniref:hypothetical protein n=1 Tax=Cupriavidus taiwanensis TaxID=164546 RepID=UPI0025408AE1|nr:hypothetical protein [Cupriavidus taiwanensis]MDK3022960.1 hypothetical protein [Cupriavidus taiwanensis]